MAKIIELFPGDDAVSTSNVILTDLDQETATKGQHIEFDGQSAPDAIISKEKVMEPVMTTDYQEKYLDARFAHIDDSIADIKTDIREVRGDIKSQRKWIIGTAIGIVTLIFTIVSYFTWTMQNQFNLHQASIQAQMQSFSEYIKAVTQPKK
jgi:hypothetical protein